MNNPIQLVPGKSDAELAEEIRSELIQSTQAYLQTVTKATKLGFQVHMHMAPNTFGDMAIQQLIIAKHF